MTLIESRYSLRSVVVSIYKKGEWVIDGMDWELFSMDGDSGEVRGEGTLLHEEIELFFCYIYKKWIRWTGLIINVLNCTYLLMDVVKTYKALVWSIKELHIERGLRVTLPVLSINTSLVSYIYDFSIIYDMCSLEGVDGDYRERKMNKK